ncbi:sensor histidine kinase [Amnibacterium endophyticum]|uniref:histidine kinase n=1 Tax=Amnibacterium endophyticum TaxID=2109337 RepID=A0ABW4LDY4_9MICO
MEHRGALGPRLGVLLPLAAVPQVLLAVGALSGAGPARGLAAPSAAVFGLLAVATVAAVLLLRRLPGAAVLVAGALQLIALLLVPGPPVAVLPLAVAVAFAAARDARAAAAAVVAAVVLVPLTLLLVTSSPAVWGRALGSAFLLVLAFGAGSFRSARRRRVEEERRRAADRQRIAVEQERVRIARELHDVLAHSLSSISVQAGVGLHLADDRPAAATEALTAIRDASRSALDEVRGVLGVLRGDERAPLAPEPGLAALPALLDGLRRDGARVEVEDGLTRPLPQPVQLALYRIVQESLTNARRHAPGASIAVALREEPGAVVAEVRDRRSGHRPDEPHAGNGMTGMRERAAQLGGTLDVRVHDDGLQVVARIPTEEPR